MKKLDTVAKGKYAIGLGADARPVAMLFAAGVPIKVAMLKEDNFIAAGGGAFSVPAKLAHPNAAVIFVNWLLTREGQSVYAESSGMPSTRVDASLKDIDPVFIPVKGEKHYSDTEEFLAALPRWTDIIKKIVEESTR